MRPKKRAVISKGGERVTLGRIVAENLRALRLGQKLSQETVAKKSGLSLSYISMLERGARTPPLDTLEALAKALAVPAVDLLRGGGPDPAAAKLIHSPF